ncbi:MAG TPA: prolyl oligopeptidase family serine peptidase [Phycisphaerales bacterium]|nr:prolyl oligopeptidase family serine peptidase [Phycisphaerales bacterium]
MKSSASSTHAPSRTAASFGAVCLASLALFAGAAAAQTAATVPAAPATRTDNVTDVYHKTDVVDAYRWLEGDNSNPKLMGTMNDEVAAWTDAQNARTRTVLDSLPGRKELEARIRPLMEIGSVSAPTMRGSNYFYTKREGKENQPKVYVRVGHDGAPRVLLDPVAVDPTGLTALGGYVPSHDGKLLAFGLYRAGDENTTTYVMDVATGEWLAEEIPGKSGVIEWLPDNSGFFYERLSDVANPYSANIKFHKLGTHHRQDKLLFRQYTPEENKELATTWGPGASFSKDGRWMVLTYWTGTASNDIWAIDLRPWWKDGTFEKKVIKVGENATFGGQIEGDTLYMLTDYKAPNKQVVAVNLNHPEESAWKTIIPENKSAVLNGYGIAKGILAADYDEKACTKIRLFGMDGSDKGELRLPGIGSAGVSVEDDRTEAYLSYTSFNYPPTIFKVDLAKPNAEPTVWERPNVPVDPSIVDVKQVTYSSKDGTPVTMFIVHKKGLALTGNNPTILTGYGGFNINMNPGFSATMFPWLEDGGVYAIPNLRGGGEYGKTWHEGGMRASKQNVFDDFIAAAQYLIENKYTQPSRLAISGGSNGGLLTGAMVTQRPDLFGAVIVAVPLLDMLRYQHFLMARYWVPEYGDADTTAEEFAWLKAYSPYHNIKKGTRYPATLITAGENDTRVHPMHARKMAAAMQDATASDQTKQPILLWVDRDAGHGQGKPLDLRVRDVVDQRMFVMWQLGMLDTPKPRADAAPIHGAKVQTVALQVKGMTCSMCEESVTTTLKKVKGVAKVTVDRAHNAAEVTLTDDATIAAADLVAAFNGTKYTVAAK